MPVGKLIKIALRDLFQRMRLKEIDQMNIFISKKSHSLYYRSLNNELKRQNKIFFFHRHKTEFITTLVLFLVSKVKKIHIIHLLPNYSINLEGGATTTVHLDCGHLHTVQGLRFLMN